MSLSNIKIPAQELKLRLLFKTFSLKKNNAKIALKYRSCKQKKIKDLDDIKHAIN